MIAIFLSTAKGKNYLEEMQGHDCRGIIYIPEMMGSRFPWMSFNAKSQESTIDSQNHRICWVGRDPSGSSSPTPGPAQDTPKVTPCAWAALSRRLTQTGLVLCHFPGKPVPVPNHLLREELPDHKPPTQLQAVPSIHLHRNQTYRVTQNLPLTNPLGHYATKTRIYTTL